MMKAKVYVVLGYAILLMVTAVVSGTIPMVLAATPTPTLATDGNIVSYDNPLRGIVVTINDDNPLSGAADLHGMGLMEIVMPATWVTANLTFQTSGDCSAYQNLYDRYGTEYTVTAAASRNIIMTPADFAGSRCVKIRSGTASTVVTQTTTVNLSLILRPF